MPESPQETTSQPLPPLTARSGRGLPRMQELGLIVVVVLLYIFFSLASRGLASRYANPFLNWENQINGITGHLSVYAIMAVGMTCVIITGGIDISVGAIMAMAALSLGVVLQKMPVDAGWAMVMPVAFLVPIGVGALCGCLNGAIKTVCRMHPFIVTLATLSIIRGLCVLYFPPNLPMQGKNFPKVFESLMRYSVHYGSDDLRIVPAIVMLIVAVLGAVFLQFTIAGRETYAVGGNLEASRYSGIRVWWVGMRVYIIMGVCCGIAAVVQMGQFGSAATNTGDGYELTVIAGAVVGGASLTGGKGTALGALLGTLVIAGLENGIVTMQWKTELTKIIVGISIILAVCVDQLSAYYLRRRVRKAHL